MKSAEIGFETNKIKASLRQHTNRIVSLYICLTEMPEDIRGENYQNPLDDFQDFNFQQILRLSVNFRRDGKTTEMLRILK